MDGGYSMDEKHIMSFNFDDEADAIIQSQSDDKSADNKITLKFETSSSDDDIIQSEPLNVWRKVDNVSDLYSEAIKNELLADEYADGRIVFVKNLGGIDKTIPNSGAYYRYNSAINSWGEILIGTHSHINSQLLDQIGSNISKADLEDNKQKYLTLKFNKESNDIQAVWKDIPSDTIIPEIPESDIPLYLVLDNNELKWTQNLFPVPAQNFQYFNGQIDIASNERSLAFQLDSFNSNTDTVIVICDNFFTQDSNIVFDEESKRLIVTISDDIAASCDDIANITALVIRNGVEYIFDILQSEYITKEEAAKILADGHLDLKQYANKNDLDKKVSKEDLEYLVSKTFAHINHEHHNLYSKMNHTHDDRYLSRESASQLIDEEVNKALNSASTNKNDILDIINTLNSLVAGDKSLQDLIASKVDRSYLDEFGHRFYTKDQTYSSEEIDTKFQNTVHTVNGIDGPEVVIGSEHLQHIPEVGEAVNLQEYLKEEAKKVEDIAVGNTIVAESDHANTADVATTVSRSEHLSPITSGDDIVAYDDEPWKNLNDAAYDAADKIAHNFIKISADGEDPEFKLDGSRIEGNITNENIPDDLIVENNGNNPIKLHVSRDPVTWQFKLSVTGASGGGVSAIDQIPGLRDILDSKIDDVYYVNHFIETLNSKLGDETIDVYSKTEVEAKILEIAKEIPVLDGSAYVIRGNVSTFQDLLAIPIEELKPGYVYNVIESGGNYVWTGLESDDPPGIGWDRLSAFIDLSNYYTKDELNEILPEFDKASEEIAVVGKQAAALTGEQLQGKFSVFNADRHLENASIGPDDIYTKQDVDVKTSDIERSISNINKTRYFSIVVTPSDFKKINESDTLYSCEKTIIVAQLGTWLNPSAIWINHAFLNTAINLYHLANYVVISQPVSGTFKFTFKASKLPDVDGQALLFEGTANMLTVASDWNGSEKTLPIPGIESGVEKDIITGIYCGTATDVID